jgi:hypothetical protein
VAEHTAWFLFLNGFHDEECRDLLRQAAPAGQQPEAMERAARFIERKLGQRGPPDEAEQEAQRGFERAMIEQDFSRARRAERIDSHAAALILQGALDAMVGSAF